MKGKGCNSREGTGAEWQNFGGIAKYYTRAVHPPDSSGNAEGGETQNTAAITMALENF
jgi:hypothetical protein